MLENITMWNNISKELRFKCWAMSTAGQRLYLRGVISFQFGAHILVCWKLELGIHCIFFPYHCSTDPATFIEKTILSLLPYSITIIVYQVTIHVTTCFWTALHRSICLSLHQYHTAGFQWLYNKSCCSIE